MMPGRGADDAQGLLRWAWLGLVICAADQATKAYVEATLSLGQRIDVLPVFAWVHVRNTGAAFSFLADAGGWQRWFFVVLALVFSLWLLWELRQLRRGQWLQALAFALVLGGALGNMLDRGLQGDVTDFVLVHWGGYYFPAFNLADAAITLGAMIWIAIALMELRAHAAASRDDKQGDRHGLDDTPKAGTRDGTRS